jgi:hypothetical protein
LSTGKRAFRDPFKLSLISSSCFSARAGQDAVASPHR